MSSFHEGEKRNAEKLKSFPTLVRGRIELGLRSSDARSEHLCHSAGGRTTSSSEGRRKKILRLIQSYWGCALKGYNTMK
jgi:hypothetical protein